jgi:hypothetical protein
MKGILVIFISISLVISLLSGLAISCGSKIQISNLNIYPGKIAAGEEVQIKASVYNAGQGEEKYSATLRVDGNNLETKEINLGAHEIKSIDFIFSSVTTGIYKIELNGLTGNLIVVNPPEFQVTSLEITEAEIVADTSFIVNIEVKNTGEVAGSYTAKLRVDGIETSSKEINIGIESPGKVEFSEKFISSGPHTLEIGGISKTVTVLKPAELKVNSLKVTPDLILLGQEVIAEAEISNVGEVEGELLVSILIYGQEKDHKVVFLEPGKTDSVTFKVSPDIVGEFSLGVKDQFVELRVLESKTYTNPNYLYSISYPPSWILDDKKPESVTITNSLTIDSSVSTMLLPANMTQEDFAAFVTLSFTKAIPGIKILPSTIQKYGDDSALKFEYSYTMNGISLRGNVVVLKLGMFGYVIVCEGLEAPWTDPKNRLINAIINSFHPPEK